MFFHQIEPEVIIIEEEEEFKPEGSQEVSVERNDKSNS